MRYAVLTGLGAAAFGLMTLSSSPASADDFRFQLRLGRPHYGHRHYYGRGGHDVYPHWHRSYTPYGSYSWYGRGRHDYRPHGHTVTPYSYRGHHYTPYGYTESIYPRYPYYYSPW